LYNTFKYYDYMMSEAKQLIVNSPAPVLKQYAVSLVPAFFGTGYEYMLENVGGVDRKVDRVSYSGVFLEKGWSGLFVQLQRQDIFHAALLLSVLMWSVSYLLMLMSLIRRDTWKKHGYSITVILSIIGYFVVFSLGPASHARYRMPTFPFMFLLVALGVDLLIKKRIIRINK